MREESLIFGVKRFTEGRIIINIFTPPSPFRQNYPLKKPKSATNFDPN